MEESTLREERRKVYMELVERSQQTIHDFKEAVRVLMILMEEEKTVFPTYFKNNPNKAFNILAQMGIQVETYESEECGTIIKRLTKVDAVSREERKKNGTRETKFLDLK